MSDRPVVNDAAVVLTEARLTAIRHRIDGGIADSDDPEFLWQHVDALQNVTAAVAGASMALSALEDEELVKQESWVKSDNAQLKWMDFPMLPGSEK